MQINPIFEDIEDDSKHYFIAKDIAEHIDIAIDEIDELDEYTEIRAIYVKFQQKGQVNISVEFLNESNQIYSWDFTNEYDLHYTNSVSKVIFHWINKWKFVVQDGWGECVNFNF